MLIKKEHVPDGRVDISDVAIVPAKVIGTPPTYVPAAAAINPAVVQGQGVAISSRYISYQT